MCCTVEAASIGISKTRNILKVKGLVLFPGRPGCDSIHGSHEILAFGLNQGKRGAPNRWAASEMRLPNVPPYYPKL